MKINGNLVVAPEYLAAEAGRQAFIQGGNVVDAAIATAFAQGVVNPMLCGIGGFGGMYIYRAATGKKEIIQFMSPCGSRATPTMWEDIFLGQKVYTGKYAIQGDLNAVGYQAITVPGVPLGLHEVWKRHGSLNWESLIEPAIEYAERGFRVDPYVAGFWLRKPNPPYAGGMAILTATEECAAIYTKNGTPYESGELLVQSDLGQTLRRLAAEGPTPFYHGDIADRIAADLEANGSFVTREDLENYSLREYQPVEGEYRGITVSSSPPPRSGFQIIEMLNIVEGFDLRSLGHNSPEYIRVMAETMKIGFADRQTYLGDPDFEKMPIARLTSKTYATEQRERIASGENTAVPLIAPPRVLKATGSSVAGGGTTHISAVDSKGNAVCSTHSLGSSAGVVTPGLGFLYNNAMSQFCPVPGLTPNSITPGRRRATGGSGTILYRDGRPWLIAGSPGGTRITTSVFQTIVNVVDFGMEMQEAVDAPRFHCDGGAIHLEGRIPAETAAALEKIGYTVTQTVASYSTGFGRVQALMVDADSHHPKAGADPRGGGGVGYWPVT